jgi:hypothetical protein
MKLIITIDTEEDNWARYSATENTVNNIERIIQLQRLFDKFKVTPTYLISFPVATNKRSVQILKRIHGEGKCEIGMHCHPWNTPPLKLKERIIEHDTMLCNLPEEIQFQKLSLLHEVICENFGVNPVSFRAGRYGFGPGVGRSLSRLAYRVDSSVTPYVSWAGYQGPDYTNFGPEPFRFCDRGLLPKNSMGALLQVPVTIGFLQANFNLCNWLTKIVDKPVIRKTRLKGIMDRIGVLNKVWLSPELSDTNSMIKLAKRMEKNKFPCLNMTFHSTSLIKGMSPFVRSEEEEVKFYKKIEDFLIYAQNSKFEPITLSKFS